MKVNCFTAAILSLSLPISIFAMGMGEIKVNSFLNQPFNAEIPITDTDGVSVDTIRVNLASVEEYSRIGLTSNEILSFLKFNIKKDLNGRLVIAITSTERIPEPFLQIVVDLAWPAGQIYRAYTILLDPPGYLVKKPKSITVINKVNINKTSLGEPGVINQPVYQYISGNVNPVKEATYGPTLANESIWQIAQRYKTAEATLPQVVLAIVGTNLGAFTQGNLNGLEAGERLKIPSSESIAQIPVNLAIEEVAAHDLAWQNKDEIKHVIFPPYSTAAEIKPLKGLDTTYYESKIAPIPKFNLETSSLSNSIASLPAPEVFFSPSHTMASLNAEQSKNLKTQSKDVAISAGLGLTLAAIDTVRTENSLIKEQLDKLKAANNRLQQQVSKQQKEMALLQEQLKIIIKERQALHAQVTTLPPSHNSSWLYWLIIGSSAIVLTYGLLYWFWLRQREVVDEDSQEETTETTVIIPPPVTAPSLNEEVVPAGHPDSTTKTTETEFTKKPETVKPIAMQVEPTVPNDTNIVHKKTEIESKNQVDNTLGETLDTNQKEHDVKQQQGSHLENLSSNPMEMGESDEINKQVIDNIDQDTDKKQPPSVQPVPAVDPTNSVNIEEVNDKMIDESNVSFSTQKITLSAENHNQQEGNQLSESDTSEDNFIPSEKKVNEFDQPTGFRKQYKHKQQEDYAVDFEAGLDKLIKPKPKQVIRDEQSLDYVIDEQVENLLNGTKHNPEVTAVETQISTPSMDDTSINNGIANLADSAADTLNTDQIENSDKIESNVSANDAVNTESGSSESQLVKSSAALDTLLSLAETYIAMEDFEAARQSLEEVMKFGNDTQKAQAQNLLQKLGK